MFNSCTFLTDITIPDSVPTIPYAAFYDCSSLVSVRLERGVTPIQGEAFNRCSGLAYIYIPDAVISIADYSIPRTAVIRGAAGSAAETYANANRNVLQNVATGDSVYYFDEGKPIEITAVPNPGWRFDRWSSTTPGVTFADASSAVTTFVIPASEATVTATFVEGA